VVPRVRDEVVGRRDPVDELKLIREFRFVDSIEIQDRLYVRSEIPPALGGGLEATESAQTRG
jgi:hypothetical protein